MWRTPCLRRLGSLTARRRSLQSLTPFCKIQRSSYNIGRTRPLSIAATTETSSSFRTPERTPPNKFRLDQQFVDDYAMEEPPFGFNGLGELVYRRTYSRLKADGVREQWYETVERVVNGTFSMQKEWFQKNQLEWDEEAVQETAQKMYERIFNMKFMPPGRGLWAMGSPLTEERRLFAALNNCGFVSTDNMANEPAEAFAFLMDSSMLGVGVGFDTKGAGRATVWGPSRKKTQKILIADSREGWVDSVRYLINAYFSQMPAPEFDYSIIRPAGLPIKGFGGISQGGEILKELHEQIEKVLTPLIGKPITVTAIVDIMNLIGKCVVAGNVRRTAEIAFGNPNDTEYIDLKDYNVNPHRASYGWTSNNSVFATLGMDYRDVCERIRNNGEPGFAWLDNMQAYGRMGSPPDARDYRAQGGNPCLEQTLESFELCCLVETFPDKHDSLEDFLETLQMAFLYAKTVTLGPSHWPRTNTVMLRNRRIGCSMSGLAQFVAHRGMHELKKWCEYGYQTLQEYDNHISEKFSIPRSIKTTSIKPSGTVSLLAGATPGIHFPEARFYIRRVRLSSNSELLPPLQKAGYKTEPAVGDPRTVVVEIPVDVGEGVRTLKEVSMWEQLGLAAFMQRHWADNQVSCTVTFDPEKEGPQLSHALDLFQYQLKGISFLPKMELGAYAQMPYEEITEAKYREMASKIIHPVDYWSDAVSSTKHDEMPDKFCDLQGCQGNERNGEGNGNGNGSPKSN